MKHLLLALLVAGVLLVALAACVPVPEEQALPVARVAAGSLTAVNVTASGVISGAQVKAGGGYGVTGCSLSAAGVLQCDSEGIFGGNAAIGGAATITGALTAESAAIGGGYGSSGLSVSNAGVLQADGAATFATDVSLVGATGFGNAGARSEYAGLPRVKLIGLGQGTNATLDIIYMDDNPTGECAPVDASVTEAEGSATSIYKFGASSYTGTFSVTAEGNDGFNCTISSTDFETVENVGAWLYASTTITAGDLAINLIDDTNPVSYTIGALAANTWTWVEVDITALAGGTGDAVTGIGVLLTTQGATNQGAFTLYTDWFAKWLTADSDTLGVAVIQDGVLSVVNTENGALLVENTSYFVRQISGSDAIVYMDNQSAADVVALVAY